MPSSRSCGRRASGQSACRIMAKPSAVGRISNPSMREAGTDWKSVLRWPPLVQLFQLHQLHLLLEASEDTALGNVDSADRQAQRLGDLARRTALDGGL